MTDDQYSELVRFLGAKFDSIDRQFVEVRRHATALFEQSRAELRAVSERTDMRFEGVDRRFDAMDQRFDAMDQRFDAMDQRFDAMDQRFDAMDGRFDSLESEVRTGFNDQDGRISAIERLN